MQIFCDTHVHCYQFEQLPNLLDAALDNFVAQGAIDAIKVLFFTDGEVDRTWRRLLPLVQSQEGKLDDWSLRFSSKTQFIHAERNGQELLLAPARQINSKHRLEFLLLGCDHDCEAAPNEKAIIDQYFERYAIVCPWGFGKWLGARGKLLSQLTREQGNRLLLGDNGGRPRLWAWVPQFSTSATNKINGSDPLPIDGELSRVANFGVVLEFDDSIGSLTLDGLVRLIKRGEHKNYGQNLGLMAFLKAQIAMRTRP